MLADGSYESNEASSPDRRAPVGTIAASPAVIGFRTFFVIPTARRLVCEDVEIELGGRAFDLLIVLLQARGCVVHKAEIMRAVWPSTIVDEGNLRFQMGLLRKALGQHRDVIKTVPGRGYLLVDDFAFGPFQQGEGTWGSRENSSVTTDCVVGTTAAPPYDESLELSGGFIAPTPAERIAELEQENFQLRLAVANLAMDRPSDPRLR